MPRSSLVTCAQADRAHNPEAVAVRVAPAMTILAKAMSPLVWILNASGKFVLRLLRQHERPGEKVTEEEIRTLSQRPSTLGVLESGEKEMIAGAMPLGDRPVRAVMTPRRKVDMLRLAAARKQSCSDRQQTAFPLAGI